MRYKSKGYVFDEEVTAWLDRLKAAHGSYNKGLRRVAFSLLTAHPAVEVGAQGITRDPSTFAGEDSYRVEYDEGAG